MIETLSKIVDGINSRMLAHQYGRELENRVIFEMQKNIENTKIMLQQSRLAQIGEMITAISYQWKEPLSAINQLVQDIPDAYHYGELNEEYLNRNVEKVACQIDYLTHTIDDFTNFFKSDKTVEHFTFYEALDPVLTLLEKDFRLGGITILPHWENKNVRFHTYKNELKQVIMNLLRYAKQELEYHEVSAPLITLSLREESDSLYFTVIYNGGSKSKEALDILFDYDFSPKRPPQGNIGLYLTKKIVTNNLGGDIVAGNDRDGVIFVIRLNKEK
jgi:signal transduction histidine kinase